MRPLPTGKQKAFEDEEYGALIADLISKATLSDKSGGCVYRVGTMDTWRLHPRKGREGWHKSLSLYSEGTWLQACWMVISGKIHSIPLDDG